MVPSPRGDALLHVDRAHHGTTPSALGTAERSGGVLDQPLDKGSFERLCFWLTWLGASLVFLCAVLSHIWNGFLYLLCQKTKVADLNFVRIFNVVDGASHNSHGVIWEHRNSSSSTWSQSNIPVPMPSNNITDCRPALPQHKRIRTSMKWGCIFCIWMYIRSYT